MTCQTKLYRNKVILGEVETSCGIQAPITKGKKTVLAEVAPSTNMTVNMNERNMSSSTLANKPDVPGSVTGTFSFTTEVVGSGTTTDVPAEDIYLRGCGMRLNILSQLTISDVSDYIHHNDLVVGQTSGSVFRIVTPVYTHDTLTYVEIITDNGITPGETFLGDNGSFAAQSITIGGFSYTPLSESPPKLTIRCEEDGDYKKEIHSAVGTFSVTAESSGIGKYSFEYMGIVSKNTIVPIRSLSDTFVVGERVDTPAGEVGYIERESIGGDTELLIRVTNAGNMSIDAVLTGATSGATATIDSMWFTAGFGDAPSYNGTFYTTLPPVLHDAHLELDNYSPIINSFTMDLAAETTVRKNANSRTGLISGVTTARAPTVSFDPELMRATDYNVYEKWIQGESDNRTIQCKFGHTPGNLVWFFGHNAQYSNITDGDRDGVSVVTIEAKLNGDGDNDFEIVYG